MGTDAKLIALKSKQQFYFDREYILNDYNFWWDIRKNGFPKDIMIMYLNITKYITENNNELDEEDKKYILYEINGCIHFVLQLPDDEIITSYNDQDDKYFELDEYKKFDQMLSFEECKKNSK